MQNVITEKAMVGLAISIDLDLLNGTAYDEANELVADWLIKNNIEVI